MTESAEKTVQETPGRVFLNMDCMEGMKGFADKHFDLAIVDPPYGLGDKLVNGGGKKGWYKRTNSNADKWDVVPNDNYWIELFRISKHQIVWGGNHFNLPPTRGVIAWDKIKDHDKNSSHWEMAWTSFDCIARIFRHCNNGGFIVKEQKDHPTQKPITLYRWLLKNYAEAGWKILDTHVGSGSSLIACEREGFDYVGYEIDKDYFETAKARIERERKQMTLFEVGVS